MSTIDTTTKPAGLTAHSQEKPSDTTLDSATNPKHLDDGDIAHYLKHHPDFFDKHTELLLSLRLSHPSGRAISLIERQLQAYRERNSDIREKLSVLLANARENDRLFELSQRLTLSLIECTELGDAFDALNYSLNNEFNVKHFSIWVLDKKLQSATTRYLSPNDFQKTLNTRLESNRIAFSGISSAEINALFEPEEPIGSAALCIARHGSHPIAIIAVGHEDKDRYAPNGGTLFLRHLSELLSRVLARFL